VLIGYASSVGTSLWSEIKEDREQVVWLSSSSFDDEADTRLSWIGWIRVWLVWNKFRRSSTRLLIIVWRMWRTR
jgi:hypothetical protein